MKMLKSELYKLKKSREFLTSLGIGSLFAIFMAVAFYFSINDSDATAQEMASTAVDLFSMSYTMPLLSILMALFTSIFVSNEFTYGTIKNYVSKGVKKLDFFVAKLIASLVGVSIIFVVYNAMLMAIGTALVGFDTTMTLDVFGSFVTTWLLFMAYTAIFVSVAMMVRGNGAALSTNVGIITFGTILVNIIEIGFGQLDIILSSNIWIYGAIDTVTAFPLESNALMTGSTVAVIYFVIATIYGMILFKKSDIK